MFRGAGREIVDTSEGLRILSSRDGSVVRTLRPLRYSHDLVIAPDGAHAVLLADGAELVSLADGASIARFDGSVAAFRPDGREVAFGTPRRDEATGWRIVRLAVPGGQEVGVVDVEPRIEALAYAPSGDALAVVRPAGIDILSLSSAP